MREQQEKDSVYELLLILLTMLGFCGGHFANTISNKGVGIMGLLRRGYMHFEFYFANKIWKIS